MNAVGKNVVVLNARARIYDAGLADDGTEIDNHAGEHDRAGPNTGILADRRPGMYKGR